jgi:hypothetical protein
MPMMVTSDMDVLSFCDGFNTHHIGTLRCRQEGHPRHQQSPAWLEMHRLYMRALTVGAVAEPIATILAELKASIA